MHTTFVRAQNHYLIELGLFFPLNFIQLYWIFRRDKTHNYNQMIAHNHNVESENVLQIKFDEAKYRAVRLNVSQCISFTFFVYFSLVFSLFFCRNFRIFCKIYFASLVVQTLFYLYTFKNRFNHST